MLFARKGDVYGTEKVGVTCKWASRGDLRYSRESIDSSLGKEALISNDCSPCYPRTSFPPAFACNYAQRLEARSPYSDLHSALVTQH
jgi:hypothetical protein